MWDFTIRGVDVYHILNWFFIYSFLGWVWETGYVSAKHGKFVNRGFVSGPFCTIYGFGALSVYLILKPVSDNLFLLYVGGVIVATTLEYVTAVLMESIFHTSWWDYSDQKFNFQGRICLWVSLGWGVFAVALFRIIHPVVESIVGLYPVIAGKIAVTAIGIYWLVDFCFSAVAASKLHARIPVWEKSLDEMQNEIIMKIREKMGIAEMVRDLSLDSLKERLEDLEFLKEIDKRRSSVTEEFAAEIQKRKEAMASRLGRNAHRFVKSYPLLNRGYRIRKERHLKNRKNKKN